MLTNPDPPLLTIGELARRTDLTVKALRHYDDADVLRPAVVDPWTGHRRYAEAQVGVGRLVRRLRGAGLPLADIRLVLQGLDEGGHLTRDASRWSPPTVCGSRPARPGSGAPCTS